MIFGFSLYIYVVSLLIILVIYILKELLRMIKRQVHQKMIRYIVTNTRRQYYFWLILRIRFIVRVKDSKLNFLLFFLSISFLDLGLELSMILYVTVTSYTITQNMEYHRRSQNKITSYSIFYIYVDLKEDTQLLRVG